MLHIQTQVRLDRLNTLGLPACAARYARLDSVTDLQQLIAAGELAAPPLILGGGSNTVFEGDVDALVLHVAIGGRRMVSADADARVIEAGAGESWHDFVRWTLSRDWPGLENLSLIPGTVGAAPIQNIGAYGLEMCECFDSLEAVDLASGKIHRFDRDACQFGYRDSVFKRAARGRFMIATVRFRLPRRWSPRTGYAELERELATQGVGQATPLQVSDAVIAIRQRKLPDPALIGNAGSFFKNPVVNRETHARLLADNPGLPAYPQADGGFKLAAGWLIEQAGWKGRDLGPVGAYEKQALVLVNRGGATGTDVRRIAEAIRADVVRRFGVTLETEPVFAGG